MESSGLMVWDQNCQASTPFPPAADWTPWVPAGGPESASVSQCSSAGPRGAGGDFGG